MENGYKKKLLGSPPNLTLQSPNMNINSKVKIYNIYRMEYQVVIYRE